MSLDLLRTVEHTHSNGEQSVLEIMKITFDNEIDGSRVAMIFADNHDNSVMVHSSDQLDRLIVTLRDVQRRHFDGVDNGWKEID